MCLTTLLRTTLKAVTVKKARHRVSPMKEEFEVRGRGGRGGLKEVRSGVGGELMYDAL